MRSVHPRFAPFVLALLVAFGAILPAVAQTTPPIVGIDPANMDLEVAPGQDFYQYANGGWLARTEIPADESAFGAGTELFEQTQQQLLGLLRTAASGPALAAGSDEAKAVRLFEQGTDMAARNAAGLDPIAPLLAEIDAVASLDDFHRFLRGALLDGIAAVVPLYVYADLGDSSVNAVYLGGPYLGLPNRDYYTEDNAEFERVRAAYREANARYLQTIGRDAEQATAAAQAVYDLEVRLALPTLTREQKQDQTLTYNPTPFANLAARYPAMDWSAYFADLGIPAVPTVIVEETKYLEELPAILADTPLDTLKDYLRLELFWTYAHLLNADLNQIQFDFRGRALGGQEEQRPLDERVLGVVDGGLGEALGKLYVAEYFPPEAKADIESLVAELLVAFRDRLDRNEWMTDETKARALEKLATFRVKVGYPDKWKSYATVEVGASYAETARNAQAAEARRVFALAGKPVDRDEWLMSPQTVNAYYNPVNNEIVFPAGILQAPFFDYRADRATNLGGIGFVIGHEITHGFDLQGSQFDAQGNLGDWWTPEDRERFLALNERLATQYDAIPELVPGIPINGQITVTENAADLGGAQLALEALRNDPAALPPPPVLAVAEEVDVEEDPAVVVFTPEQRFFISAATVWRIKYRDEALATQLQSGVHSPSMVRGVQPLRNTDAFFEAFDIVPGEPMWLPPAERVVIW